MKMNCQQVQRSIYSSREDEFSSALQISIQNHIANCSECKDVFEKVRQADALLARIKTSTHQAVDEDNLIESIMYKVRNEKYFERVNIIDYLVNFVRIKTIRIAMGLILLISTLSFIYMNYNDTIQLVSLEKRIGDRWNNNFSSAAILQEESRILNLFYNTYRLLSGKSSFLELNQAWVLLKKEDLKALFANYNKLDESTKARLAEIRIKLLNKTDLGLSSGFQRDEINFLREEIKKLTLELEKSKRGMK